MLDLSEKETAAYLQDVALRLERDGVSVRCSVGRGGAVSVVLETAVQERADLIVLATHALGTLESFWAKSLTPQLMRRLPQPVMLVRAEGDTPDQ
jgi:nucleotide-binding universal stress UspA family protein